MLKIVLISLLIFLSVSSLSYGQEREQAQNAYHFSGSAGITNNGISLIPNFSLEKPAALFNLSIEKGSFSFDPEFNFSTEAKPWYILFWLRYKIADTRRFHLNAGTHLGLNFKQYNLPVDVQPADVTIAERYAVGELYPNYLLTKNVSFGLYYLFSKGLDPGTVGTTNFIKLNINFSKIDLFKGFFLAIDPQVYYLRQDGADGFYFASTFMLAKNDFPITVNSTINKVINTEIAAGKDFVWNVSFVYSFGK